MKRILINATHSEEVRVALCKGKHLYDFDLENRTREQKKANIYKGHITRVEPSLEAVFVEYGSKRQGFLPIREIASDYLSGNPREENIRKLIKEGDELIVQVEKEERGNKGAALSTYISLAGRYLVLMPNNPRGGGISRQISGKLREDMKRMLSNLDLPKSMSVIVRTAGIGKTQEDLQHDLNHLLNIWNAIQEQNKNYPSPRLVHQEAGVVTRAVRDYLRDDIAEIWIDNEEAFIEAETFIKAVMPKQVDKLRKYTDSEPMFSSFDVEKQIETAYQREVRLPSGGSIVIDQTEALVSIDINSAKSTKGADVAETAYHTNLEAADEIARQLRLRDMGGLIVIDFIDMTDSQHQKEVEKRLIEATKYDRARVQFGEISRFGLMEMSRQRLRPSLEESTGYICPRCHGNGMIRDLRSLSLSIMRQIEQTALKERHGEVQAEVPTDIAAFLLNEKRESLVYLEQDSGTRITILPHAHLESPNFNLHFNHQGFAPSSYERITDTQEQEANDRGYEVNWQTAESERPEQQPVRQPRSSTTSSSASPSTNTQKNTATKQPAQAVAHTQTNEAKPSAVAWLSNLFAPTPQAQKAASVSSADAAQAIEAIVNTGAQSRGMFGEINAPTVSDTSANTQSATTTAAQPVATEKSTADKGRSKSRNNNYRNSNRNNRHDKRHKSDRKRRDSDNSQKYSNDTQQKPNQQNNQSSQKSLPKREPNSKRQSRGSIERGDIKTPQQEQPKASVNATANQVATQNNDKQNHHTTSTQKPEKPTQKTKTQEVNPNEVVLRVSEATPTHKDTEVVHISIDDSKVTTHKVSKDTAPKNNDKTTSASVLDDKNDKATDANVAVATPKVTSANVDTSNTLANTDATHDESADASLSFDTDEMFADRYITAQKFGQASNDPRVVKASIQKAQQKTQQQAKSSRPTKKADAKIPKIAVINGTVGEFIHTHLAQPDMRLAKDGVISCFIAALNAHSETSGLARQKALAQSSKAPKPQSTPVFSFVNFGYQSLSPSYLHNFAQMTSAVAEYSTKQGKTTVTPAPIGARASNDPRGQHPSYISDINNIGDTNDRHSSDGQSHDTSYDTQAISKIDTADKHNDKLDDEPIAKDVADTKEIADTSATSAMKKLLALNVGQFIEQVLHQEGLDMIQAGQTEAAFLKALRQPLDKLMHIAQAVDTRTSHTDDKQTTDNATDIISTTDSVDNVDSFDTLNSSDSSDTDKGAIDKNTIDKEAIDKQSANDTSNHQQQDSQSLDAQPQVTTDTGDTDTDTNVDAKVDTSENANVEVDNVEVDSENSLSSIPSIPNKTSIESYKSMIETISEQLSTQTSLLNLTSPKVPKTRSRKTKKEPSNQSDNDE